MNKRYLKYTFLLLTIIGTALSCKVTKPYRQPDLNTNDLYRGQTSADSSTIATMPWESLFADTVLKALIHEGLYQNFNLKIAIQKIEEARAAFGQTKAAFLPGLNGNASVTQSKTIGCQFKLSGGYSCRHQIDVVPIGTKHQLGGRCLGAVEQCQKIGICKPIANRCRKTRDTNPVNCRYS